jgi:hypothetical protein
VPPHILACYTTMLPRLEARRRLEAIADGLAIEGRMLEDHGRTTHVNQLERQVEGGRRRPRKATVTGLKTMGIKVEITEGGEED